MKVFARIVLVIVLLARARAGARVGVPLCKEAKADTDYAGAARPSLPGFYYSILDGLGPLSLVVGGLIFRIWLARRRLAPTVAAESLSSPAAPATRSLVPDSRGAQP
jgi:hypothetical protein